MKYWTLFTLRMMARAGLSFVIGAWVWCATQSVGFHAETSSYSRVVWACSTHVGWAIGSYPAANRAIPFAPRFTDLDTVAMEQIWPKYYLDSFSLVPGAEYRHSLKIDGHMLHFKHWFLCLTFLIATVATHWRWRKPAPVQENDT